MPKNTCSVLVLDVSPTMGQEVDIPDDQKSGKTRKATGLALGIEYLKEKVGEKLWDPLKTDKAGVFLFGCDKTSNALAGVREGYENVFELIPITSASNTHYDKLRKIKIGSVQGDALSALIVAQCAATDEVGSKKAWTKEVILVTDGRSYIDWDGAEQIRDKLNEFKIELTVVGVNFDDVALGYKEEDKPDVKQTNEIMFGRLFEGLEQPAAYGNILRALNYVRAPRPNRKNPAGSKMTLSLGHVDDYPDTSLRADVEIYKAVQLVRPKSQHKMSILSGSRGPNVIEPARGVKRKRESEMEARERSAIDYSTSLGASQAFAASQTQTVTLNGSKEADNRPIDRNATFGVQLERKNFYVPQKTAPTPLETLSTTARTATQAREEDRARDEASASDSDDGEPPDREEVPEDVELVKAYKYGATRVPITGIDESDLILDAKAGIEILGFAAREDIRREQHLGNSWWVFGSPASGRSQITISILAHAMYEKDYVAIVRVVPTSKNAAPKLAALYPRFQPEDEVEEGADRWEGFVMLQLPFSDDIRQYAFNSLSRIITKSGKNVEEHRNLPTEKMTEAMRRFVDSYNLDDAGRNDDGEAEPWFRTTEVCNPAVHAVKRAILHRTANPLDPDLPTLHVDISRYLVPPETVTVRSEQHLKDLKETFDIRKVPPKPTKSRAGGNALVAETEQSDTAIKVDDIIAGINQASAQKVGRRQPFDVDMPALRNDADADVMDVDSSGLQLGRTDATGDFRFIGLDDPLGDFERVKRQRPEHEYDAVLERAQLCPSLLKFASNTSVTGVAHELFKHTVGSSAFGKIVDCMRTARSRARLIEAAPEWNRFMEEFRNVVLQSKHLQFWDRIRQEGLGLISVEEIDLDPRNKQKQAATVEETQRFLA